LTLTHQALEYRIEHIRGTLTPYNQQYNTRFISWYNRWWSLSGKGDEDLHGYNAVEEKNDLGNLSQGMLDSGANVLGASHPYILYLWEYLNAHDLLKMSFQHLEPKVANRNRGKGVPLIIQPATTIGSPSNDTSTLETSRTKANKDAISISINMLGENNVRAVRIEPNATKKYTAQSNPQSTNAKKAACW
jgi:hypothetical protein